MDAKTVSTVKRSWARVAPVSDAVADIFYARLFHQHPELRGLFPEDMRDQKLKLIRALRLAIENLEGFDDLRPVFLELGEQHAAYGVRAEHYAKVGAAMLWTLEQALGCEYTLQVRSAWTEAFGAISTVMMEGGRGPSLAQVL